MSKQTIYKWALTNSKYVYLTNNDAAGLPFITTKSISSTKENEISKKVENFTEEEYKTHYDLMWNNILSTDKDAVNLNKLDYTYYWNIDNSECGLVEYGYKGKDGRGIAKILQKTDELGLSYLEIHYTDGTIEDNIYLPIGATGADGKDGADGVDGANGFNENALIIQLSSMSASIDDKAREELENLKSDLTQKVNELSSVTLNYQDDLSKVSGQVTNTVQDLSNLSGNVRDTFAKTIDGINGTVTEYTNQVNTLSGLMNTVMSSYNSATSATTQYQQQIDTLKGQYSTSMSRLDSITNNISQWKTEYDAELNRYSNIVSELTNNGEISASELYQNAHEIGMMVSQSGSGGSNLTAAIIASINNNESEIQLKADKIYMLGETVASSLTAVDLSINKGACFFGKNGSGFLAQRNISWDEKGNVKINGDLELGKIAENLQNEDVTLSKSACKFKKDGSGYLANGNIEWTSGGELTIKNNVRIEGALTVGDVAKDLNNYDVAFCSDNQGGYNCLFKHDGGGYLGHGAIAWTANGDTYITGNVHIGGNLPAEVSKYLNLNNTELANGNIKAHADGSVSIGNGFNCTKEGLVTINSDANIIGNLTVKQVFTGEQYPNPNNPNEMLYPIELRENGSGQLAKGNIWWDEDGNIFFGNGTSGTSSLGPFWLSKYGLTYSDIEDKNNFDIRNEDSYLIIGVGDKKNNTYYYGKNSVALCEGQKRVFMNENGFNIEYNDYFSGTAQIGENESSRYDLGFIKNISYAQYSKNSERIINFGNSYNFYDTLIIDKNITEEELTINLDERKIGNIVILKDIETAKTIYLDIKNTSVFNIDYNDILYLKVYNFSNMAIYINLNYVQQKQENGTIKSIYYKSLITSAPIYSNSIVDLVIYDNSIHFI